MPQALDRPTLDAVQRLIRRGDDRCAACGRTVEPGRPNVRVHGAWFHQRCSVYRSRRAAA